jgi:hypothetical protein
MSLSRGPKTITNGLVLYLDAANKKSYPGSGTSWTDLSGNSNTGTLTNGPTFSAANMGSILFDGTNDYVDCGNNSSIQITVGTISAWMKTTTNDSSYRGIIAKQYNYSLFVKNSYLIAYDWGNSADRSTSVNVIDGTWKNVVLTFSENSGTPSNNAIFYINGISVLTSTIKSVLNSDNLLVGRNAATQEFNGNIAMVQIYNRVLSATEVAQNYTATKSRFGL